MTDKMPDDELIDRFEERIEKMQQTRTAWQLLAQEAFAFYASHQWDDEDLASLKSQKRPVITFNKMKRFVRIVVGIVLQNKGKPHYLPRTAEDRGLNDMLNSAAAWARDQSNAEYYEILALTDMLVTGIGCTNEWITYIDGNEDGELKKERVNPLHLWVDEKSTDINFLDGNDLARLKNVTEEEMLDQFDISKEEIQSLIGFEGEGGETVQKEYKDVVTGENLEAGLIPLYEYQYRIRVKTYRMENPIEAMREAMRANPPQPDPITGQPIYPPEVNFLKNRIEKYELGINSIMWSLEPKEYRDIKDGLEAFGYSVKTSPSKKWKYYKAFISGRVVLEHEEAPLQKGFSYKFLTGEFDEEDKVYTGMVHDMKDPARYSNKAFSQLLHVINSNPKGGLIIEKGAANKKQLEREYASGTAVSEVEKGGLNRIKEKAVPHFNTGYESIGAIADNAFLEVTGVNLELLGQRNAAQAGVLEAQRIQQGMTALAPFMNPFRLYMKSSGESMIEFVRELVDNVDGRLIRVIGEGEAKNAPLLKDNLAENYDVIIEEVKSEANQDREDLKALTQAATAGLVDSQSPFMKQAMLELMPMREELKEAALQDLKQQQEATSTQGQENAELEKQIILREKELEFAKTEAETQKLRADAAVAMTKALQGNQEVQATELVTGIRPN